METTGSTNTVTFPEGLSEAKIGELIEAMLGHIDRERLLEDKDLVRVQHPLIQERIGKDVALNVEIHNAFSVFVSTQARIDLTTDPNKASDALLGLAKDMEDSEFKSAFTKFQEAIVKLAETNPGEYKILDIISGQLHNRLKMPEIVQESITYPPVTVSTLGESNDEALKVLEECRATLLRKIKDIDNDATNEFRAKVETEYTAAKEWFTSQ